jgi:hypothetical protein
MLLQVTGTGQIKQIKYLDLSAVVVCSHNSRTSGKAMPLTVDIFRDIAANPSSQDETLI